MNMTFFKDDLLKGKIGEEIFKEDFLDFLNINYIDITNCQQFQVIDSDYFTKIGLYEIKLNYKDDNNLIIEDYTNINKDLAPISNGWFYKSKADLIVFISKKTKTMIFMPMTNNLKLYYEKIKNKFSLIYNKVSINKNQKWQSAYRIIPFDLLKGFISIYQKIN